MSENIPAREITPRDMYFNRRAFLRGGLLAGSAAATAVASKKLNGVDLVETNTAALPGLVKAKPGPFRVDEPLTSKLAITNYNNFYEFTTNKDGVAAAAAGFRTDDWKVEVGGLCHAPATFDMDAIRKLSPPEERIYRMRCVEAWSMVIPWAGYSLSKLLERVRPTASAKYVAFQTLLDPTRFPNQDKPILQWPYVEGLRLDEAMHPLALLATGLYGAELPPQDGAPIRLVVPWKYGFKGIKSIVKITLVDKQPPSTWNRKAPGEYGFFANVNPNHPHPRWSQATEQRIGELAPRKTLMFNGYGEQVAHLYTKQDLRVDF